MRISNARLLTRYYSRNAGDTTFYPSIMVDAAAFAALEEIIRRARLLLRIDTIDTVAGTDTMTGLPTRFRPDRILGSPYLSGTNVTINFNQRRYDAAQYAQGGLETSLSQAIADTADLDLVPVATVRDRAIGTGQSGQPYMLGFKTASTFQVFPNPDKVYTVNVPWNDFATPYAWSLGAPLLLPVITGGTITSITVIDPGSSPAYSGTLTIGITGGGGASGAATIVATGGSLTGTTATVTNAGTGYTSEPQLTILGDTVNDQLITLADDLLLQVLLFGAPAFLQHNQPEAAFATPSGTKFKEYIESLIGTAGGMGAQQVPASPRRR